MEEREKKVFDTFTEALTDSFNGDETDMKVVRFLCPELATFAGEIFAAEKKYNM